MKKQVKPLKEKDDTLKKDSNELNSFLESWKKVIKEKKENDKKEKQKGASSRRRKIYLS